MQLAAGSEADVLLPHLTSERETEKFNSYPHFARMGGGLAPFPKEKRRMPIFLLHPARLAERKECWMLLPTRPGPVPGQCGLSSFT